MDDSAKAMIGGVDEPVKTALDERQTLFDERRRQSQKLEAIGRLAGGVAHDLNNALTAIVGYTELALSALESQHAARSDVLEIRLAAQRAEAVTRHLLTFCRKQLLEPRVFSLNDSVTSVGRLLERLLGRDIELKTATGNGVPPIYGDPGQIEQAIVNLAINARDAMPRGGRLTFSVLLAEVDEAFARAHPPMTSGRYVELRVSDTGHGMTAETQARIFEPFFTTKDVGKGTGLGLAMVCGTVQQSGGFIVVESEIGRGTTFRLFFPPAPARDAPGADAAAARAPAATVLVVEDERAIRNLVVTTLMQRGHRVLPASSAEEALRVAADESGRIDLLLADASMPGMSGLDLARTLVDRQPQLPVIVMSGYAEEPLNLSGLQQPVMMLPKPFTPADLRRKVSEALAGGGR